MSRFTTKLSAGIFAGLVLLAAGASWSSAHAQIITDPPKPTPPITSERPMEYVLIETSHGDILLELNREKAPASVKNFLSYVQDEFYDGTIFHRVIPTFMIQGGGFPANANFAPKQTKAPIRNEGNNGLSNERGTVAMARTNDPDSATSQFFINTVDNAFLDQNLEEKNHGYAVFGKVIAGMETVDTIKDVKTTTVSQHSDVPVEPVTMKKVRHLTPEEAERHKERIGAGA
ncbi:MAG: peptidylprolyl isomerase [Phycisphaerales bacterium]